jgi:hypothetical protein
MHEMFAFFFAFLSFRRFVLKPSFLATTQSDDDPTYARRIRKTKNVIPHSAFFGTNGLLFDFAYPDRHPAGHI